MGVTVGATYSRNDNNNVNTNINADTYYYFEQFPKKNINPLDDKMSWVRCMKDAFIEKIPAGRRTEVINNWIDRVERRDSEIKSLLGGYRDGVDRVMYASNIESMLEDVKILENQGTTLAEELKKHGINVLESTSTAKQPYNTLDHPTSKLIGIECNIDKIVDKLGGTETAVIGIWGACGIGKSTVLRVVEKKIVPRDKETRSNESQSVQSDSKTEMVQSNNGIQSVQRKEQNHLPFFSKVILVKDTHKLSIKEIQNIIVKHLGEYEKNFDELTEEKGAKKISEALAKEKLLLMLDDVREPVNLNAIGISRELLGCKIVFTTRSWSTCIAMQADTRLKMEPLSPSDSLTLFQQCHRIEDEKMLDMFLRKCAGLPLSLITVALGTAARNLKEVYRCLNHSPTEIEGMKDKVLDVLKPSFESLKDKTTKSCFLFFVLFQDSKDIDRNTLKDYWMAEGLINNGDKEDDIVEQLHGSCLLEKTRDGTHVKLHNIVRCMAIWLAHEDAENGFYAGEELSERVLDQLKTVKRASFVDSETDLEVSLKQVPDCVNLVTLLMRLCESRWKSHHMQPKCRSISYRLSELFRNRKFPICRVLDMAHQPISSLPRKLFKLRTLRYLNLSYTSVERLPSDLGNLTELILLDLTGTKQLQDIPDKAISSLLKLKALKFRDSSYYPSYSTNEQILKALVEMLQLVELQLFLQNSKRLKWLVKKYTKLSEFTTYIQMEPISSDKSEFEILKMFKNLEVLSLKYIDFQCERIVFDFDHWPKIKTLILRNLHQASWFSYTSSSKISLRELHISCCNNLKTIECLCLLEDLEILKVETCEEIVKLLPSSCIQSQHNTECLGKLKSLKLDTLTNLKKISDCILPSKDLKVVSVHGCPNLKKLQFDHSNGRRNIEMSCEKEWWDQLEWESSAIGRSSFDVPFV